MSGGLLRPVLWLLVGLGLAELGVRLVVDTGALGEGIRHISPHGERLHAYTELSHRRTGDPITPWTVRHPRLGTAARPGTHVRPARGDQPGWTATVDPVLGRAPVVSPADDPARIGVFGDSFTYGYGVDDADVYTARVATERPDLQILDRAVPGHGHDQILDSYRLFGPDLDLDLVVLGAIDVDAERNVRSFYGYEKPWYTLDDDGILHRHGTPVPDLDTWTTRRRLTPRLLDVARVLGEAVVGAHDDIPLQRALEAALLTAFVDLAADRGQPVLILWLPNGRRAVQAAPEPIPPPAVAPSLCARPHVTCADAGPAMAEAVVDGLDVQGGPHWSPAGHAVIASVFAEGLREAGWPPP